MSLYWLAGLPTHDATNSFKAYRRDYLENVEIESQAGFSLGIELTVKAHFLGYRVEEVPTVWHDRSEGESRFRLVAWMPQYLRWYFWALVHRWLNPDMSNEMAIHDVADPECHSRNRPIAFFQLRPPDPSRNCVAVFNRPIAGIASTTGGQDEDWFAVPGWTVLNEGIPRIPYLPARNPETAFYRADTALYALPPAQFYLQSPIFAVFGPSWGTARVPSFISGIVAILLVYQLGKCVLRKESNALWAAGLYSVSRVFYFPCLSARPDVLCGAIGLGAIYTTWRWQSTRKRRMLFIAGGLAGMGFLAHPFALVYSLQIGIWVLFASRDWRQRILNVAILSITAIAVLSTWLLLIRQHPDIFRIQFFNNVLDRSGPGLFQRIMFPFESIWAQAQILVERAGLIQTLIMVVAMPAATFHAVMRRRKELRPLLVLAWSSVFLHLVLVGTHPTKGYYCYTGAFLLMCLAACVTTAGERLRGDGLGPKLARFAGGFILVGAFVPGSGIRTCMAYLQNWDSLNHDSARFSEMLLTELPPNARFTVDTAFVLEFYLAGRATVLAKNEEFFFESDQQPYDYLIVGRFGIHAEIPKSQNGRLLKTFGDKDDIFSCYAEIYVPNDATHDDDNPEQSSVN